MNSLFFSKPISSRFFSICASKSHATYSLPISYLPNRPFSFYQQSFPIISKPNNSYLFLRIEDPFLLYQKRFLSNQPNKRKEMVPHQPEEEFNENQNIEEKYLAWMSKIGFGLLFLGVGLIAVWYQSVTEVVPSTGRRRWVEQSESSIQIEGQKAFQDILTKYPSRIEPDNDICLTIEGVIRQLAYDRQDLTLVPWVPYVLVSEKPFFFAYPGGELVISTGMLSILKTESELACLIAHSMGHMAAKHHLESIVSVLGDRKQSTTNKEKMEREADEIALQILTNACYDPEKYTDFWLKFETISQKEKNNSTYEYIHAHKWKERIHVIEKELLPRYKFQRDALSCYSGKDRPLSTVNIPKSEASQFY